MHRSIAPSLSAALIAVVVSTVMVQAVAADPPRGSETVPSLYSPSLLGGGAFVTTRGGAFSDAVNPASTGLEQLVSIDAGYSLLPDFGGAGFGHAAGFGVVVPTRYAVFSSSLRFHNSPFPNYPIGTGGGFRSGASKDLFPDLTVGAAFGADFGVKADGKFDWRLGLDLGLQGGLGDFGILKNLRYGAALTGIGSIGWVPQPFTPTIGAAFDLIAAESSDFGLNLSADLGFPSFSNVSGRLGLSARLGHLVELKTATGFNLLELIKGTAGWAIPSIGLTVNLALPGKTGLSGAAEKVSGKVAIATGARPLYENIWGFGAGAVVTLDVPDRESPDLVVDYPAPTWISPNSDGKADTLEFALGISDRRYIAAWAFEIRDGQGKVVWTLRNRERRLISEGYRELLNRLVDIKSGVEIPTELRWDGLFDSGAIASDGRYTFTVSATDDNGNRAVSPAGEVNVDNTPPAAEIISPKRGDANIFSPDGDGNKDAFAIVQTGSVEDAWDAVFRDAEGTPVRHFRFQNAAPESLVWDGRDDVGAVVADGVYRYEIKAVDRGLNERSLSVENIIVDTERPSVAMTIDEAWISPNGDGIKDGIWFGAAVSTTEGLVSWKLDILDQNRIVRRTIKGETAVPGRIRFDGKADTGTPLAEGGYSGAIDVLYDNGFLARAESARFGVDLTAPSISVGRPESETLRTFSPDGDGRKDSFVVVQSGSSEELWTAAIKDVGGKTIRSFTWENAAPVTFSWDGLDETGRVVADGRYSYDIAARDKAGNAGLALLSGIVVDKSHPSATLSVAYNYYSPNGDNAFDELPVLCVVQSPGSAEAWTFDLLDAADGTKRSYSGLGIPPERLNFGGDDNGGVKLAEGVYRAKLIARYRNGYQASALSPPFTLDLTPPSATVAVRNPVFSPNRDGNLDTAILAHEGSQEIAWTGEIRRASDAGKLGDLVRGFKLPGLLSGEIEWDGLDDRGLLAADGRYAYRVIATDRAGNIGASALVDFQLTTANTPILVNTDRRAFSPNGDGLLDSVLITAQVQVQNGIVDWRYDILDLAGKSIRGYQGKNTVPPAFRWDGRNDAGRIAEDGSYTARITLRYEMGNEPTASSALFTIDTTAPNIVLKVPEKVFSPNDDGIKDTLYIERGTNREEDEWSAAITNVLGTKLRTWTWRGAAGPFVWDGKDDNGNRVPNGEYSLQAESRDPAGNFSGAIINGLVIDTEAPFLEIVVADPIFSPNGDGVKDGLRLDQYGGGDDEWVGSILNGAGVALRSWRWPGQAESLVWDGLDDAGRAIADGSYRYRASSTDTAGNSADIISSGLILDTRAPAITLDAPDRLFSPNGDGRKDFLPFRVLTDGVNDWSAALLNAGGQPILTYKWKGVAPAFAWDGKDAAGNIVPDGAYTFTASSVDAAGNTANAKFPSFIVDNRIPRLYLTLSVPAFSPNGDGKDDEIAFNAFLNFQDGVKSWRLEILDETGAIRRVFQGDEALGYRDDTVPTSIAWDGRDNDGAVKDGRYSARLIVAYAKGDAAYASSGGFNIDISPPVLNLTSSPQYFSPDGDGVDDELTISLSARDATGIDAWSLEIREPRPPYQLFYKLDGRAKPTERLEWDGRSQSSELVQAATDYTAVFRASDALGNAAVFEAVIGVDAFVVRKGESLRIITPSIVFRENASDFAGLDSKTTENNVRILRRVAELLNKYREYRIVVEGHDFQSDRKTGAGTAELQSLSERWAKTVAASLAEYGVEAGRLSAVGLGDSRPLAEGEDQADWWKNRRMEFLLVK